MMMVRAFDSVCKIKRDFIPGHSSLHLVLPGEGEGLGCSESTMLRYGEVERCMMFMSTAWDTVKSLCEPDAWEQMQRMVFVALDVRTAVTYHADNFVIKCRHGNHHETMHLHTHECSSRFWALAIKPTTPLGNPSSFVTWFGRFIVYP